MRLFRKISFILASLAIIGMISFAVIGKRIDSQIENSKNRLLNGSFTAVCGDSAHDIKAFFNGEACYLFLPRSTRSLRFSFNAHHALIDGKEYSSGDVLALRELEGEHRFSFVDEDGTEFEREEIEFILSGNIPSVFIDSASGRYLENQEKNYKEYCGLEIVNADGTVEYRSANRWSDRIRGRGNLTWTGSDGIILEKKPYNLYLKLPASLLGMEASGEWALLANFYDRSNIRNKFVYDYADHIGLEYSPNSALVEVYFDNEYRGVYLLSEKVQVAGGRVDIGDGGVLFSMEAHNRLTGKPNEYESSHGQALVRAYPEANNTALNNVMIDKAEAFEKLLFSDFTLQELKKLIDIDSWAKIMIIEELFENYDAWKSSQYFYIKPGDGKIYAGPVWDFDISSASSLASAVENSLIFRSMTDGIGDDTLWSYRLMQNEEFYGYVCDVFRESVYPDFERYLNETVEEYGSSLGNSDRMNRIRWGFEESDAEVFRTFTAKRLDFLKRIWIDREPYSLVTYSETGLSLGYFENEICPADVYYQIWFFDKEYTRPAGAFVPKEDTVLYANFGISAQG